MMDHKIMTEIASALQKAAHEGQPIPELLEAVRQGAELDAWFEPKEDGKWDLIITVRE